MWLGQNTVILIAFSLLNFVISSLNPREIRLSFLYPLTSKTESITNSLPFGSAFTVALDAINNNSADLFPFAKLTFLWNDTQSLETVALKAMTEHYYKGVDAFIGPGDQNECRTAARMAAAWNIPIVSYFCTKDAVSNKSLFPTFARTRPPNAQSSKSLLGILKKFDWRVVAILHCNPVLCNDMDWLRAKKDMKTLFNKNGIKVSYENILPMEHNKNETSVILQEIKRKARIVILSASISYVQSFLVAAQRKGMTSGQYVYIINELTYEYLSFTKRDEWWEGMTGLHKDLAEKAFHSVLALVPRPYNRTKYARFEKHVTEKFKEYPFNGVEQNIALYYSAYLYDAVYLYALAVNKTIAQGLDPKDGTAVFGNIRETSYQSITGFEVRVDKNGDAEFNMTLFSLQKNERGENEMLQIGELFIDSNGSQTLELQRNKTLTWSDTGQTRVPADSPVCGFNWELCPAPKPTPEKDNRSTYLIVTLVICFALIVAVSILLTILYRKKKFEKELTRLTWKVNYHEIKFHTPAWKSSRTRSNSMVYSVSSFYGCSSPQLRNSQVGRYKATHVYVKKFERYHMEISRNELLELKQVYELHHSNLARFVGACVEPPNIYTLTEFCSRGSIQDIILDDNIKLDSMFIRSLAADIVEGMIFLHSSEIKVHGNLKSSNCLVDGRWVLKITDFGLWTIKNNPKTSDAKELLWTAPEKLRSGEESSTPKGDVYSFAIILQEMETRTPPFYEYCLDVQEIIDRVKFANNNNNPFRPKVAPASKFDDLCMLMTSCWSEDPDDRPSFREIKRVIITLQGGRKENIVDKVIYLLEDYSSHLEDLVRERTEQWIEEKKKTEELLHNMLPKSVADQLIAGSPVKADYFEEVSIFFSDIVGFTPFCSLSSPLEIVNFLNDLYTLFDSVTVHYDVYKVETIGDAYMVASGLPIRNGHEHARHIADMALDLFRAQNKFVIRHKPKEQLKLRIGIHSGAVCAGVVGLRMPRYCLFGDAVNMASRMESSGEALKIHISMEAKSYLDRFGGYDITERGNTLIKGKGHVVTYWLNGRLPRDKMTSSSPRATTTENISRKDDFVSHPDVM